MKIAFLDIGGDLGGAGKKIVKIDVGLGSFNHITSNMYDAATTKVSRSITIILSCVRLSTKEAVCL